MSSHTAQTELKLIGKLIVEGDIACQTGLHIGAGKGSLEIGGADNPVVKDAFGLPYIPGSSLRGKLRSMLEQSSGLAVPSELVYISNGSIEVQNFSAAGAALGNPIIAATGIAFGSFSGLQAAADDAGGAICAGGQ